MSVVDRLAALGIVLPTPPASIANYVGFRISGSLLVISGQIALGADGKIAAQHCGKLGMSVSPDDGRAAARICLINVLAQAQSALGSPDRITACLRLGGFINVTPDFTAIPMVMNGASDLIVEILGDAGRHARSTIGVASLPLNSAVEVEALFEIAA